MSGTVTAPSDAAAAASVTAPAAPRTRTPPPPPSSLPLPAQPALAASHHPRRSYFPWAPLDPFVAGLTAGTLTTLWLHPVDLLKTRLQVGMQAATATATAHSSPSPAAPRGASQYYRGSIHAGRVLVAQEGWRALWKGLSPNLVGNASAWGLYMCGFDVVKKLMSEHEPLQVVQWVSNPAHLPARHPHHSPSAAARRPRRELNALEYILAASLTGTCVSAMTNPIWVIKTRMFLDRTPMHATTPAAGAVAVGGLQSQGTAAATATASALHPPVASLPAGSIAGSAPTSSLWSALKSVYASEGVFGLYRGFVPGLLGVSHGALQFMCYEELKKLRKAQRRSHGVAPDTPWTAGETVAMSAASKAFASYATYPYQVVRSRLQAAHGPGRVTLRQVVADTWREEGVRGFYRGVALNLMRVLPAACSVFLVYEQCSGYMKRHATYVQ